MSGISGVFYGVCKAKGFIQKTTQPSWNSNIQNLAAKMVPIMSSESSGVFLWLGEIPLEAAWQVFSQKKHWQGIEASYLWCA